MFFKDEVLFSGEGLRVITLNRPKALNALNQNMAELITGHMQVGDVKEGQSSRTEHAQNINSKQPH